MKKHRTDDIFSTGRRMKRMNRLWKMEIIKYNIRSKNTNRYARRTKV